MTYISDEELERRCDKIIDYVKANKTDCGYASIIITSYVSCLTALGEVDPLLEKSTIFRCIELVLKKYRDDPSQTKREG